VLEALLGDQAVRTLADKARESLLARARKLLDADAARFDERLATAAPAPGELDRLDETVAALEGAR
jgi:hypothetical protein